MKRSRINLIIPTALVALGVFSAWAETAPINCATAQQDIAHLEHEKKSTVERIEKGVTSIVPIGLVLNTVAGKEQENMEMATGEYNEKIDQRIAEIKQTCGIE